MSPVNAGAATMPKIGMIKNHPATIPDAKPLTIIDGFPITEIANPYETTDVTTVAKTAYPSDGLSTMEKLQMTVNAGILINEANSKNNGAFCLICHDHHFTVRYFGHDIKTENDNVVGRYGYALSAFDEFKAKIANFGHMART